MFNKYKQLELEIERLKIKLKFYEEQSERIERKYDLILEDFDGFKKSYTELERLEREAQEESNRTIELFNEGLSNIMNYQAEFKKKEV